MQAARHSKKLDDRALLRLVNRTGSPLPWERSAARSALLAAGPEVIAPILKLFAHEQSVRKRLTTSYRKTALVVLPFILVNLLGCYIGGAAPPLWIAMAGLDLLLLFLVASLGTAHSYTRQQALLGNALALFNDLRVVGPLIEVLQYERKYFLLSTNTKQQIKQALIPLMRHMGSEDAAMLDAQQRGYLRQELETRHYAPSDFVVVTMEALTRIGDTQAIPHIRRIARSARDPVRTHAQSCLAQLEALAAQERQSQTLLRASNPGNETPSTVLLRAAQAGSATDPQRLLRATDEQQP